MRDESEFREYIAAIVGEADADLIADFSWNAGGRSETMYLTTLAEVSRAIANNGPEAVRNMIAEAKKASAGEQAEELSLADISKQLVELVVSEILQYPIEKRQNATAKCWKRLLTRMRKQLVKMFPHASEQDLDRALALGCIWDKESETMGIEPLKLVDALRSPRTPSASG